MLAAPLGAVETLAAYPDPFGTAPVEGHISGIVDIPNACATLYVPTEIFGFDIMPNAKGPKKMVNGKVDLAKAK